MNHRDWYDFCMELQIHVFSNSTFVFPYHCQQQNQNHEGFNIGDPELDDNVDVPKIYETVKDSWNTQLFDGLSQQGTLPPEATNILKASSNNGFTFMYNMHNIYNPLLMSFLTSIIPTHPMQNGKKLADHYNAAIY